MVGMWIAFAVTSTALLSLKAIGAVGKREETSTRYPNIDQVEAILAAPRSFSGKHETFEQASDWFSKRLQSHGSGKPVPYLVCAGKGSGREAFASLERLLSTSAIHPISHTDRDGSCFVASLPPADEASVLRAPGVSSVGPLLPSLKLAPSLLDHVFDQGLGDISDVPGTLNLAKPLQTVFGVSLNQKSTRGLSLRITPGVLPKAGGGSAAKVLIRNWRAELVSRTVDLHAISYWADPEVVHNDGRNTRLSREWRRAATVVHDLAAAHKMTPGEACGFDRIRMIHADDDLILFEGLDHLLPITSISADGEETKMACFMGLLSQLAAKQEVLRVTPRHGASISNAVASAITQSSTISETPLHDAGIDGTGEVIQVIDTGLDETSCFFSDDDGLEIDHGHLYRGLRSDPDGSIDTWKGNYFLVDANHFPYNMTRRKVVQYVEMFDTGENNNVGSSSIPDDITTFSEYYYSLGSTYFWSDWSGSSSTTSSGDQNMGASASYSSSYSYSSWPSTTPACRDFFEGNWWEYLSSSTWSSMFTSSFSSGGFHKDKKEGHGTHVAGTACGSTSQGSPFVTQDCRGTGAFPACVGGCVSSSEAEELETNGLFNIDTFCPAYDCDGTSANSSSCLGEDTLQTLVDHGGVAPGAKIAFFDASFHGGSFISDWAGNSLWNSSLATGAKVHSSSWGMETFCQLGEMEFNYDTFMYENPENLLIFAAGNSGGLKDIGFEPCTVISPALGKNVLSVGATSAGASRAPLTGTDGRARYEEYGLSDYSPEGVPWICLYPFLGQPSNTSKPADKDTVSFFSSYGPTTDGRIKPELVAPGERVFSVSSDGSETHSCRLLSYEGTSMATPVVAGAAALVRQYFSDPSFYVKDLEARGLCEEGSSSSFPCNSFSPTAATVKAMLINSANAMGGSTRPDNSRGFGRVHLEAGMPLNGNNSLILFVAEAAIEANHEIVYTFDIDDSAGLELRATLCWIDTPTIALSTKQLQHDLDLFVVAPNGVSYTMWGAGEKDNVNVNERVVIPAESIESGKFSATVSVGDLLTDSHSYSLVVTAAIVANSANGGVVVETRSVDTTNDATDIVRIIIVNVIFLVALALAIGGVWAIRKYYRR